MRELRIHGRGGQGSVTAAELIAVAAFEGGVFAQAFPAFGVERRGAPVQAFVRFDDKELQDFQAKPHLNQIELAVVFQ